MQGDGSAPKPSPASLIPIAVIAAAVLGLALFVSGGKTGTIVIERITMSLTTITQGKTIHPRSLSVTTINETSAAGIEQRSLTSSSFTRPGFEQVFAGDTIQLYDPADNTVYVTTLQGEQRAQLAQVRRTAPKGAHVSVGVAKMQLASASANSIGYVPGRTSVYEKWLRDGTYRLVGHDTVDGRAALKLVEASPTKGPRGSAADFVSTTTVYVTPGSYEPIESVNRTRLPGDEYVNGAKSVGVQTTSVTRWRTYRVLPATAGNQRLLSLTARHPHARVVDNATAFLRAGRSEIRTTSVRTG